MPFQRPRMEELKEGLVNTGASLFSKLPSIEKLVRSKKLKAWEEALIHSVRVRLAQRLVDALRKEIKEGKELPSLEEIEHRLEKSYQRVSRGGIQKVVNATGVVLHTNLGRAPLGKENLVSLANELNAYSSLEFDVDKGIRGSRTDFVEEALRLLCGVPAALVVNNNAATILLILHELARNKEVILSRGELVQIGGGFRVPDVLRASGASLVEVGTTNMTSLQDYAAAIGENTALLMKVHQSNFYIAGHTQEADGGGLSQLAKEHGLSYVVDLGSGYLSKELLGFEEPTIEQTLRQGADLVTFSGDKLLGGPQAGIIVGDATLMAQLKKSPLYRALRLGKTELFLLEQTLKKYLAGGKTLVNEMLEGVELESRCQRFAQRLEESGMKAKVVEGKSPVGGGALPQFELPSPLIQIEVSKPEKWMKALRAKRPVVVVRVENKQPYLDLRTVLVEEEEALLKRIKEAEVCTS